MSRLNYILFLGLRDAWANKLSLLSFCLCCFFASLSLMSLTSLKEDLNDSINENTKSLLGADFLITSRSKDDTKIADYINDLDQILDTETIKAKEISFTSMARFEKADQSRLVQISGITNNYPLYGEIKTSETKSSELREGWALVDNNLGAQYDLHVGDEVLLGNLKTRVAGFILQVPGAVSARNILAPKIIIPISDVEKTSLIRTGSIFREMFYFKFLKKKSITETKLLLAEDLKKFNLDFESSEERGDRLKNNIKNVAHFFDLVILSSFILGGIGIGSGFYIYLRQKRSYLETLICLGLRNKEVVLLLASQIASFGLISVLLGSSFGLLVQRILPWLLYDFLPLQITSSFSIKAFATTNAISLVLLTICVLAATASNSLSSENAKKLPISLRLLKLIIFVFLFILLILWSASVTNDFFYGLAFSFSLVTLIGCFVSCGVLLMFAAKKLSDKTKIFTIQQSIRNLYRPNNQVASMLCAIGFSVFVISTSLNLSEILRSKITSLNTNDSSNLLLFDIQIDQLKGVTELLDQFGLKRFLEVPIVNMRIQKIKNLPTAELKQNLEKTQIPNWTLTREYRSTYRNHVEESEKITSGKFPATYSLKTASSIPISVENGLAEKLDLKLGDNIEFNVQGVSINTHVSSLREVDWQQIKPNFFFVFPEGVLESAPKTFIVTARYDSESQNSMFRSLLTKTFGNISSIDLTIIINTLDSIAKQLKSIILFLTGIIVLTSLLVLSATIWASRSARIEENAVLRVLGAKNSTIYKILAGEYLSLSIVGGLIGLIFSSIASVVFSLYYYNTYETLPWLLNFKLFVVTNFIVLFVGILGSLGTLNKTSMKALREIE